MILPFDHILPDPTTSVHTPSVTAILYADVTSPNLRELHETLQDVATSDPPKVQYVLRWAPPAGVTESPRKVPEHPDDLDIKHEPVKPKRQYLTGYGVGLDLKKMEYSALDDRRSKRKDANEPRETQIVEELMEVEPIVDHIREMLDELPPKNSDREPIDLISPLTKEEFKCRQVPMINCLPLMKHLLDLGVKASQLILSSSNPFKTLDQLIGDFPRYATQLARSIDINGEIQYEMAQLSKRIGRGGDPNMIWMNGKVLDPLMGDVFDPFG